MSRSIWKGPFVDPSLLIKVEKLKVANSYSKRVISLRLKNILFLDPYLLIFLITLKVFRILTKISHSHAEKLREL